MNIRNEVQKRLKDVQLYSQEGRTDPIVHCKLFHAYGSGTWYLTEYDGNDIAFGYVTGLVSDEWGYVSISELEALHIGGSIPRTAPARFWASMPMMNTAFPNRPT